jgi:copper chaperone
MNQNATPQSRAYSVVGMTCGHCVASVREEVAAVGGVRDVDVDLDSGQLVVSGAGFDDQAVKTAVQEAGYQLAA